jgi:outer membrane receptor protein involved in Fe transport
VTKPEKAVHLELGVEHRFPGALSLTLTLYRKSYTDLLAVRDLVTPGTSGFVASSFNAFTNDARATAAGVEVDVDYHPPSGFFGRLQYAHSAARGSDSYLLSALGKVESSRSPSGIASADPFPTTPLEYQRTHRATAILGYSGPVDPDDPFLSGFGIAALVSFSSGHPYTPEQAIRFTDGSSTPWNMGVSYLHDPRAVEAAGPQNSATTPSVFGIDLALSKEFAIGPVQAGLFLHVLNLLDTRADLNVYPRTGTATDDGFLSSPTGMSFAPVPGYADFYRTINNANRWAYMSSVGNDLYNHPRQVRVGVRVSL